MTSLSGTPPPPPRPHLFSIYSPEGISWPINLERFIISCSRHPCVGKCAALQPPLGAMLGQGCQVGAEILPGGNNLLAPPPPQGPPRTLLTSAGSLTDASGTAEGRFSPGKAHRLPPLSSPPGGGENLASPSSQVAASSPCGKHSWTRKPMAKASF